MDIQVASNFERLIFDALNCDDKAVISLMNELKDNGNFKLKKETLDYIQRYFSAIKITDDETSETIKKIFEKYNFLVDPHTAIGIRAEEKINNKVRTVCLATAHPYKFVETVEKVVDTKMEVPVQGSFLGPKEKYEILENDMDTIKKFIESKL